MNLKFVKTMNDNADPQTGQAWQTLWMSGADFYIASSRQWNTPWELLDETMVFRSDSSGNILDYGELAVTKPAAWTVDGHKTLVEEAVNHESFVEDLES